MSNGLIERLTRRCENSSEGTHAKKIWRIVKIILLKLNVYFLHEYKRFIVEVNEISHPCSSYCLKSPFD